jgi:hypothetical protein
MMNRNSRLVVACWPVLLTVAACAAADEPGLLVRLYDVGEELQWLPELTASQLPNEVKVVPTLDLRLEKKDFGALAGNFLTEVVGRITIAQAGGYTFRLVSDDGARLWIDEREVVDHDGGHGPTPKDGRIDLTAGPHDLRILHFNGTGGAQLSLFWLTPAPKLDGFELVPAGVLSHTADLPRETAPGKKKVIPALRRGRPGDGTPVAGVRPNFTVIWAGTGARSRKELENWPYRSLRFLAGPSAVASASFVWLPPPCIPAQSVASLPLDDNNILVAAYPNAGLYRVFAEPVDDVCQGCVFQFTQGLAGPVKELRVGGGRIHAYVPDAEPNDLVAEMHREQCLVPTSKNTFEMLAVRAQSNGFAIEFTKPLDPRVGWEPESYYVEQWPFNIENGINPHRDGVVYPVKSASVTPDRRNVFLEIENLKPAHVVYVRLLPPCVSEDGELPWSTEAWYTLNVIPPDRKGEVLTPPPAPPQNVLTEDEKQAGWRLLFDGQTSKGWHGFKKDKFPDGWKVTNGCLVRVGPGGDITTDDEFDDFEFSIEWRISPAGNSGIMYRVTEDHDWPWQTGPEYQILDNTEHPDGKDVKTSAASCYALYAPARDATGPVGLFNKTRIVARGGHVEHWLNAVKVVEYELGSPEWNQLIKDSKFSKMPDFGRRAKGKLNLQDHGDKVWYRNIKLRVQK